MPDEYLLWEMAETFGWPLDYILGLPEARWREWLAVRDGKNSARASIVRR